MFEIVNMKMTGGKSDQRTEPNCPHPKHCCLRTLPIRVYRTQLMWLHYCHRASGTKAVRQYFALNVLCERNKTACSTIRPGFTRLTEKKISGNRCDIVKYKKKNNLFLSDRRISLYAKYQNFRSDIRLYVQRRAVGRFDG